MLAPLSCEDRTGRVSFERGSIEGGGMRTALDGMGMYAATRADVGPLADIVQDV